MKSPMRTSRRFSARVSFRAKRECLRGAGFGSNERLRENRGSGFSRVVGFCSPAVFSVSSASLVRALSRAKQREHGPFRRGVFARGLPAEI